MKAIFVLVAITFTVPALACSEHSADVQENPAQLEALKSSKVEKVAKKNEPAVTDESAALFPLGAMEQVAP